MGVIVKHFIILLSLVTIVEGRILSLNSSDDDLISDGIEESFSDMSPSSCSHKFGFMPCAENTAGYIFLIVAYQILLAVAGQMVNSGSEVLIQVIRGGRLAGVIFRILKSLPSMMLVILSGVVGDKESAQAQVLVGVGVNAGTTVFTLTIQWGFVMFYSKIKLIKKFCEATSSSSEGKPRIWKDTGVNIDEKTQNTAGIMLLSLIPYVVLQLVFVFKSSLGIRVITLIALAISSLSLLLYFIYQILDPSVQERSLIYSMFDKNKDKKISLEEFIKGLKQWSKSASDCDSSLRNKSCHQLLLSLFKGEKQNEPKKIDKIMAKILKHSQGGQLLKSESLISEKGEVNTDRITKIFHEFAGSEKYISAPQLKKLIAGVDFESYELKEDDVLELVIQEFDTDKNQIIDEKEFVKGMTTYLEKAIQLQASSGSKTNGTKTIENNPTDQIEFVDGMEKYPEKAKEASSGSKTYGTKTIEKFDRSMWGEAAAPPGKWEILLAISQLIVGIAMLTILGGPLTSNILLLSQAIGFSSFIFSFIVVPVAMNCKVLVAALLPAESKSKKAASLTFSEIYNGVIMNNLAGMITLLAVVYAKDLTWDFSAEVLTILVVCGSIGSLAYSTKTYYLGTCILAFILYPLSLGLFYLVSCIV